MLSVNPALDKKKKTGTRAYLKKIFSSKKMVEPVIADQVPVASAVSPDLSQSLAHIFLPVDSPLIPRNSGHITRPAYELLDKMKVLFGYLKTSTITISPPLFQSFSALYALYLEMKHLTHQIEEDRLEFKLDIDLQSQKEKFHELAEREEERYQQEMTEYQLNIQKMWREINDLDEQITRVNTEQLIGNLRELETYQHIHQELNERINKIEAAMDEVSSCHRFFWGASASMVKLQQEVDVLEKKRARLASNMIDEVRKDLVEKLTLARKQKQALLEVLIAKRPEQDARFEETYIQLEARARADELEYYYHVPDVQMLQFVQLSLLIRQLNVLLSAEEVSLSEDKWLGVRTKVSDFKSAMKERLNGFYCMEPGRYYFEYYLERVKIDKAKEAALLSGKASIEIIRSIFPHYQPEMRGLRR